jgi:hypothetical protein
VIITITAGFKRWRSSNNLNAWERPARGNQNPIRRLVI